ncbi:MAG: DUF4124 domain-containing protein [Nitrosomonas halophila]
MHFTRPSHLHSNLLSPLKKLACLAIALLFLPGPLSVASGVYRSEDARGRITYSDIPTPAAKPLQLNVQPARVCRKQGRIHHQGRRRPARTCFCGGSA